MLISLLSDITQHDGIAELHGVIKRKLPPLGGIASDTTVPINQWFLDMDADTINNVLGPKINGIVYFDKIFSDTPLDFFILFSTLSSVVGTPGESCNAAADAFMAALVKQRHSRGQAASIVRLGYTIGVGAPERDGGDIYQELAEQGFMATSEADVHYLFAQSIVSGLPGSTENLDIVTGLQSVWTDDGVQAPWLNNPRFSHVVFPAKRRPAIPSENTTIAPLKLQLSAARTVQEATEALESKLLEKRRSSG